MRAISYGATEAVKAALARIGRTEDLRFSPGGARLALAGFDANRLLLLGLDIEPAAVPRVAVTGAFEIESPALARPHGVDWIDENSLVVANRHGGVALFRLPKALPSEGRIQLEPALVFGGGEGELIRTPGSVAVAASATGRAELFVCSNYGNYVTRHLIDCRDGYNLLASDRLLAKGLNVPDGVARSGSGRWIAVSNHDRHAVYLYRNDGRLHPASRPSAVLRGMQYPHGLRFAGEDTLIVADAGAPHVHLFISDRGRWAGMIGPTRTIRVLSDAAFCRGRANPREGGPKGIDLTADGVLAVTNEEEPLALFDFGALLPEEVAGAKRREHEYDGSREVLLRYLLAARCSIAEAKRTIRRTQGSLRASLAAGAASWRGR